MSRTTIQESGPEQVTTFDELAGKTIERTLLSSTGIFLRFTDGSYVSLVASRGYDGDVDIELGSDKASSWELLQLGFISEEEHTRRVDAERRSWIDQAEARERQEYERLKARFGAK